MQSPAPPAEPKTPATAPSRQKRLVGVTVAVLVAFGACYLVGFLHGKTEVAQLKTQLGEAQKAAESTRTQLESEKRRGFGLEARRCLDQAVTALDARNFGIAERQVKLAGRWLVDSKAEARLAELAKTLEIFHLVATEDLGPQRKQLADWIIFVDESFAAPNP
jgi:hypothetical protein